MTEPKNYVIRQGHLFWREDGKGYSENIAYAGLYTDSESYKIESGNREPLDRALPLADFKDELEMRLLALETEEHLIRNKLQIIQENS